MRKGKATCIEIQFHVLISQWLRTSEQLDIQPRVKLGVARTGSRTQFVTGMDTLTKDPLENGLFPVLVVCASATAVGEIGIVFSKAAQELRSELVGYKISFI
ncbi:unnamed protein product [Sphagnum balticum]